MQRCKTSYNHKLERLIHLFFDFARQQRIGVCEDKGKKGKQEDNILIQPPPKVPLWRKILCCCCDNKSVTNEPSELSDLPKEIEWFYFAEDINVIEISSLIWEIVEFSNDSKLFISKNKSKMEFKKININTATLNELLMIPYIGKNIAEQIINHRQNNRFKNIEELITINSSLKKKFYKIKDFVEV